MEHEIRHALADKDYSLAQTLADNWLNREPQVAVAHYLAAWARDAQGLEADALVHYEKAFDLGLAERTCAEHCLAPEAPTETLDNSTGQRNYFKEASGTTAMSRSSRLSWR